MTPAYRPNIFRVAFPLELHCEKIPSLRPQEIILGEDMETGKSIYITEAELQVHAYILGQTGMGKSYFLWAFYANLLALGKRVFAIDPLGAYYDLFSEIWLPYLIKRYENSSWFHKNFLQKIIFLDLSDKNHPYRNNLIAPIGNEDLSDVISRLLKFFNQLLSTSEGGDDALDVQKLRRLNIVNLIPIFAATKTSFSEFDRFIMNKDFRQTLCSQAEQKSSLIEVTKAVSYWRWLEENLKGSSFIDKTFSLLTAFNQFFESPMVRNFLLTEETNTDWLHWFNNCSVFIKFPIDDIAAEDILTNYIYTNIFTMIKQRKKDETTDSLYIVADEAASAPIFNQALSKIVCISRNKKVFFHFAHQARLQLVSKERMRIAETIEAQSGLNIYFRISAEDSKTTAEEHMTPNDEELRYVEQSPTFTQSISSAFSQGLSKATSWAKSLVFGKSFGETTTDGFSETEGYSDAISIAKTVSKSFARAEGKTQTFMISDGQSFGITTSKGVNQGRVVSNGFQYTQSDGYAVAEVETESGTVTISSGQSSGSSDSRGETSISGTSSSRSKSEPSLTMTGSDGEIRIGTSTGSTLSTAMMSMSGHFTSTTSGKAESTGNSKGENKSRNFSNSLGTSKTLGKTISVIRSEAENFARTVSEGKSFGESFTVTKGVSHGESLSKTKTKNKSFAKSQSLGKSVGENLAEGNTQTQGVTEQESVSKTVGESVSIAVKKVFFSPKESLERLARKIRDLPKQHAFVSIDKQKRCFIKMANCPNLPYRPKLVEQVRKFHQELAVDRNATFTLDKRASKKKKETVEVYQSMDFSHFLPEENFD